MKAERVLNKECKGHKANIQEDGIENEGNPEFCSTLIYLCTLWFIPHKHLEGLYGPLERPDSLTQEGLVFRLWKIQTSTQKKQLAYL